MNKMKKMYKIILSFIMIYGVLPSCDIVETPYMNDNNISPIDTTTFVKKVLIEDFTGHRCQNCPDAAAELSSLQDFYGDQVIGIAIHPNTSFAIPSPLSASSYTYDFRTQWGNEIDNTFDISSVGLPRGMVNRIGFNSNHRLGKDEWAAVIQSELEKEPIFGITLNSDLQSNSLKNNGTISVEVSSLKNISEQYNIVICLTENGIVNWQKHTTDIENYEHNHVLRTILNTTIGESIGNSFTIGDKWIKDYIVDIGSLEQYNIDYSLNNLNLGNGNAGGWIIENMEVLAYIYNVSTKEIVQSEIIHLTNN
tara:strand:- start:184 stop:1110 length:927 start_codon:yes stop_codon:yes gene_type:complete